MPEYAVKFTPRAIDKIEEIYKFIIVNYSNIFAAISLMDKIKEKCNGLTYSPKASTIKITVRDKEFRFAKVKNYTIIYYIDEINRVVHIYSVEYSRRNLAALLK